MSADANRRRDIPGTAPSTSTRRSVLTARNNDDGDFRRSAAASLKPETERKQSVRYSRASRRLTRKAPLDGDVYRFGLRKGGRRLLGPLASHVEPAAGVSSTGEALPQPRRPRRAQLGTDVTAERDRLLVSDLLVVLMGQEGDYIRFSSKFSPSDEVERMRGPVYSLPRDIDPMSKELLAPIFQIAAWAISINTFTDVYSQKDYGLVNQALCAGIRRLMKEYFQLVTHIERDYYSSDSFSLHRLHVAIMPSAASLSTLHLVVEGVLELERRLSESSTTNEMDNYDQLLDSLQNDTPLMDIVTGRTAMRKPRAKEILDFLSEKRVTCSGDISALKVLTYLDREASRPYISMLNEWLFRGRISDPANEFLVQQRHTIEKDMLDKDYTDDYWEKRYSLRLDGVPTRLEAYKERILLAGKYFNVVRECGGGNVGACEENEPTSSSTGDTVGTFDDPNLPEMIEEAYKISNRALLALLMGSRSIEPRLRSLKRYFFMDSSDYLTHFLDLASHELKKPAKAINTGKLQNLLELVLRQPGSISSHDPYKDDLSVQMNDLSVIDWLIRIVNVSGLMDEHGNPVESGRHRSDGSAPAESNLSGFNALQLDFKVPFPASLVLSRKTIVRYQVLSRHILSLMHVQRNLSHVWQTQCRQGPWKMLLATPTLTRCRLRAFALRAKMLSFIQQMQYFVCVEVIDRNWHTLCTRLEQANTVDELMRHHVDFLDTCLKECMLTNGKLLKIHSKLSIACQNFAIYQPHLARAIAAADEAARNASDAEARTQLDRVIRILDQYEKNFEHHLKVLLDACNYFASMNTSALLSLVARLEWVYHGEAMPRF